MIFRCAGIVQNSIVDGLGMRQAVFFQGCAHLCEGCHNQHTWHFSGGYDEDTDNVIKSYKEDVLLSGVTLTGGDPLYQPLAATDIAKRVKELGGNVWCYTGFVYEDLLKIKDKDINELLLFVDILVDGPFIKELKNETLAFRGSENQRILKLKGGYVVDRID